MFSREIPPVAYATVRDKQKTGLLRELTGERRGFIILRTTQSTAGGTGRHRCHGSGGDCDLSHECSLGHGSGSVKTAN